MKIEIEVSDFYFEDGDFQDNFKAFVVEQLVNKTWEKMKAKVEAHCAIAVEKDIEKILYSKLNTMINDTIKDPDIKLKNNKSIQDVILEKFLNESGWNNPTEIIKKLAKEYGAELKQRYDIIFATQVVAKLHENGLLKDGAEKLLLKES